MFNARLECLGIFWKGKQMTWKEFKEAVEKAGTKDNTKVDFIEIDNVGLNDISISIDIHNELVIYEKC